MPPEPGSMHQLLGDLAVDLVRHGGTDPRPLFVAALRFGIACAQYAPQMATDIMDLLNAEMREQFTDDQIKGQLERGVEMLGLAYKAQRKPPPEPDADAPKRRLT